MTGRRARAPHDPVAAQTWFALLSALFILAAVLLGMSLGVLVEAWGWTWRVVAFAIGALVCAEGGVVSSARFRDAVDGPGVSAEELLDADYGAEEFDDEAAGDRDPLWEETP